MIFTQNESGNPENSENGINLFHGAEEQTGASRLFSLLSISPNYGNSWSFFLPAAPVAPALIRHGFDLNGRIEGSLQLINGETTVFNSSAVLTGDFLVPGSPTLTRNGNSTFGGTVVGSGNAQPTNYSVTLNSNSRLGRLLTRTNPATMLTVAAPPAPTGTRNVTINSSSQSIGDFTTLKNLTLNSNVGNKPIPPGTYGAFTINGGSGLILGTAGSSQPTVYNLATITLNSNSQLQVVGPVILTIGNGLTLSGAMGSSSNPAWLQVKVAAGGVTLNSGSVLYANVTAPTGTVTINSVLEGNVTADRLTVNSNGVLRVVQTQIDTTAPTLNVQQPNNGLITNASQITVSGTYSDESPTTIRVNGTAATINGNNFTATTSLAEGNNTLSIQAVDSYGNQITTTRNVVRDSISPTLTIAQPNENAYLNTATLTVLGTVQDQTTTTVTVNGVAATISGNNYSANIPINEGNNTIISLATDAAGNSTSLTRHIIRDTVGPIISITQPVAGLITNATQITVSGTYNDQSQTAVTVNGQVVTVTGNSFSTVVNLVEGSNAINISAVDVLGNTSQVSKNVIRDTGNPLISLRQPAEYSYINTAQISVAGSISDATASVLTINNTVVTTNGNAFNFPVSLPNEGNNTVLIRVVDAAGNQSQISRIVVRDTISPEISLTSPTEGAVAKTLSVRGNIVDASPVSIDVSGQPLVVEQSGGFSGDLEFSEGTQTIRVTARDAAGNQTQIARSVNVDLTPPVISNISPSDETIVDSPATVSGRVSDASTVTVKINGISVAVANGTFTANNITLDEGENEVTIVAADAVNNVSTRKLTLKGRDHTPPASPVLFQINTPTKLAFQTIEGQAEPGSAVIITGGLELVTAQAAFGTGIFAANVKLNIGVNNLTLIARDAENNSSPAAQTAVISSPNLELPPAGSAAQINISSGNSQKGLTNTELPRPLIAIVTDQTGDPVQGVPVTFTIQAGGGQFTSGGNEVQIQTDTLGHAAVRYISGAEVGLQQIRADFSNNLITPAVFLCESLAVRQNAVTSVAGSVLDQNLRALPNVIVRISGQQTRTGNDGRFVINNVPTGPHQLLELIGRDQINLPGRWTNITYDFDVLPGVKNQIGRPLFLPKVNDGINLPLDQNNVVTQDTTYELPVIGGEPPIKVTAKAGTRIIFPADVSDKRLSVTRIATNRVPMTLEDGLATNLYISVQPSGAVFETPLEISFPNADRLPVDSEVSLMSFDHDAGRYVKVGTGHVSADGRIVKSDSGSGIRVGAWHALPPPEPAPEVSVLGHIQIKDNPTFEGKEIINKEAWVEGTRAVPLFSFSSETGTGSLAGNSSPSFDPPSRLDYRATFSLPRNQAGRSAKMEALTQTQTVTVEITPNPVFIGLGKTIELTATLPDTATGTPTFKWKTNDDDIVKVNFASGSNAQSSPNRVVLTGGKKAGTTKVKLEYKSTTNGRFNAEVTVNVIKVEFQQNGAICTSGFDDTKVGTAPNIEPFWQTVVANGTYLQPTGGSTAQANVTITPAAAATMIRFGSTDATKATVAPNAPTASPQTITLTSVNPGETFVTANLNGVELARLGVVVRKNFQIPVTFHFVSDTGGHATTRATTLTAATTVATNFLRDVNAILKPQTGVEYVFRPNNGVVLSPYPGDLTDVVSFNDFAALSTLNAAGDGQDFYFVWELEEFEQVPVPQPGQTVTTTNAINSGTLTVIDDTADSNDVAHEMMHSVGVTPTKPFSANNPRHSSIIRELLYPTGHNGRGCLIPKRDYDTTGI